MWRPRNWSEVEALIGQAEETPSLDFKKEAGDKSKNEEIAKDIAAMTVNGGVLLYGVDEDKKTRVASATPKVPLNGFEERLRSIAGSRIAPAPDFDVEVQVEQDGDADGVVVVVIPPSPLAPHQVNGRYPCRRGTITDSLTEPEVERLYRQRRELAGPTPSFQELLTNEFVAAPSGTEQPADGVGELALVVRPVATDFVHPAGAWQDRHLRQAVQAAYDRQRPRFANITLTNTFQQLLNWEPMGAKGWTAGSLEYVQPGLPTVGFAATLTYPARLSFQGRWGLVVTGRWASDAGTELFRTARELEVIRDLTAFLAIAGEYFADVNGAGALVVGAQLFGFEGGKSEAGIDSPWAMPPGPNLTLRGAPDGVESVARVSAPGLRDEPELTARILIERWLPPFLTLDDGRDAFDLIVPPTQQAEPQTT